MNRTLAPALAAVLALAACGPADADNVAAPASPVAASGQDMPAIAQVGFNDLLRDPAAPFIGAENADVTIIGFVDYNCPYCKKMQPEIDGLLKADPRVRVLYKDWPIFGDVSEAAARTALAAGYQGKYEAVHNAFMLSPSRIGDQADITRLAQSAGVNMARLTQDLADHGAEIDAVLERNNREAAALALQGTPAFIINGNLIPGGMPQAQLEAVIGRIRSGQPLR
jgi:protein-disulfide isomerase